MTKRRSVALFAGLLAASSSIAVWSAPTGAQPTQSSALTVLHTSANPRLPDHSVALGAMSPSADVHVEVALKVPDPAAVSSFIASLSDRTSPNFHHFLHQGQFGELFGPPLTEVAAVEASLRSAGLHPGPVTSDRLLIPVTAPASAIDRAFRVSLVRYRLPGGRAVFTTLSAPSVTASVSSYIQGIIGLSDLSQVHSLMSDPSTSLSAPRLSRSARVSTAGPTPCTNAVNAAGPEGNASGSLTADELAAIYDMSPLYAIGDFGQGVHVALVEFEEDQPTDIAYYQTCYGTSSTVNYLKVDGGAAPDPSFGEAGSGEAALDIEDVIGLAPKATIDVYQGTLNPDDAQVLDVYSAIINAKAPDEIVSTGWGDCELDSDAALLNAEQTLIEQATTQGQAIFAAAGDTGSNDCFSDQGSSKAAQLSVDDPASQPGVIGVGGTSIRANSETVWNGNPVGAGGGGVSSTWCMPSFQDQSGVQGLINSTYSVPDKNNCKSGYWREVPDVSADADPNTGYEIYWKATWRVGGGTSASTPLWAAAAALIDSSPFCSEYDSNDATGTLVAGLYAIASTIYYPFALNDVTTGNNFFASAGYKGSLTTPYPATKGYDMASGLGTPWLAYSGNFVPGLAALTCFITGTALVTTTVTGVSPKMGASRTRTSVTIGGKGFLPIAGADELTVGKNSTKLIPVTCETTTRCTAVLPATTPGTADLRMIVEDLTASPLIARDRYSFVGAPTLTNLTPAEGSTRGGTRITIRGTNFFGKVSVHFGTTLGTRVAVRSSSQLTVTVPPGSGGAYVTVSALGGTSHRNGKGKYHYVLASTKAGR